MKLQSFKIPGILMASALALIGLVVFQLSWMRHSKNLAEEIFSQRVSMALCNAVENFSGGVLCGKSGCAAVCGPVETPIPPSADFTKDSAFKAELRHALNFYQINLDYDLQLTNESKCSNQNYQCMVSLPDQSGLSAYVNMSFPGKDEFVSGKMDFMVLATIAILLFTALVLLFANWSLMKQKRLLQTNVDFFNNMAHEFRTPLTNMGLAVNMLTKKHPELADNQYTGILKKENKRLMNEVERVLRLASLEKGDHALQKEKLPLKQILQASLDDMAMMAQEKQAQVHLEAVPDNLFILADRHHLVNVFRNLIDNALKYNQNKPDVHISVKTSGQYVVIQVNDNGIGIKPAQQQLIFEKFKRVCQGELHHQEGYGLGLAYVKRMVEMHGGSVKVESQENLGSRFQVSLPISNA
ncbi:MAG: HAMP domain-containing histidine kinase [Saprospiraceae bacterium]|nr:HAMP domain-containing histidine kinase [Saprospiraceae bacterium]